MQSSDKQKVVDSVGGKDPNTIRTILGNVLLTSTGAAKAIGKVLNIPADKCDGESSRVPVADGSIAGAVMEFSGLLTVEVINDVLLAAFATRDGFGVIEPGMSSASSEAIGEPFAGMFIPDNTKVIQKPDSNSSIVDISSAYDNEFAYAYMLLKLLFSVYRRLGV